VGCCRRAAPRRGDSAEDRGGATKTAGAHRRRSNWTIGRGEERRGEERRGGNKGRHIEQEEQLAETTSEAARQEIGAGGAAGGDEATTTARHGVEDHQQRSDSSTGRGDSYSTAGTTSGGVATDSRGEEAA